MLENFYNQLAPFYKYLYPDWEASLVNQADILDGIIREYFGDIYDLTIYFLEEMDGEEIKISTASGGRYYCIEIDQLENLFLQAGFKEVITIRNCYNQPLLLAQRI